MQFFNHRFIEEHRKWLPWHFRRGRQNIEKRWAARGEEMPRDMVRYLDRITREPMFTNHWYKLVFAPAPQGTRTIDVTPEYSTLPPEGVDFMAKFLPQAKFVYIIRHPVDRAISQLKMNLSRARRKPATVEDWLAEIEDPVLMDRGDYMRYVPRWNAHFGPDRLLYLPFGMIARDPLGFLRRVEDFLGLRQHDYRDLGKKVFASDNTLVVPDSPRPAAREAGAAVRLSRTGLRPGIHPAVPLSLPLSPLLDYIAARFIRISETGKDHGSYQFVYHMDGVSKTYPGGKKTFENIRLNFLPGVKIGVVGVNGAGKSTLLRIMAGIDKDFTGEAWAAKGATVGYLPQEPQLDPALNVRGNVMEGVKAKQAKLDRYNELAMNYSDETAEEMAKLQDEIDAENLWDLDSQIDIAMERCAARRTMPTWKASRAGNAAGWRCASCCWNSPTCCFWTNRPTTWTPRPSPGCKST